MKRNLFATTLKKTRKQKGMTQVGLALKSKVGNHYYIMLWETGRFYPRYHNFRKLDRVLHFPKKVKAFYLLNKR